MPTLAGLLIVVGFSMIKLPRIETVWHTGPASATIMVVTFVATLFAPIQVAVAVGVVLTILIYVFRSAEAVRLERIVRQDDGTYVETEAPEELPSGEIVILQPIGSLFFAGVAELEEHLPNVGQARGSVVIFRLRDRDEVGSTFIRALDRYTRSLQAGANLLMLEGLNERVVEQLAKTDVLKVIGEENVFPGQPQFGAALGKALSVAEAWIAQGGESTGGDF